MIHLFNQTTSLRLPSSFLRPRSSFVMHAARGRGCATTQKPLSGSERSSRASRLQQPPPNAGLTPRRIRGTTVMEPRPGALLDLICPTGTGAPHHYGRVPSTTVYLRSTPAYVRIDGVLGPAVAAGALPLEDLVLVVAGGAGAQDLKDVVCDVPLEGRVLLKSPTQLRDPRPNPSPALASFLLDFEDNRLAGNPGVAWAYRGEDANLAAHVVARKVSAPARGGKGAVRAGRDHRDGRGAVMALLDVCVGGVMDRASRLGGGVWAEESTALAEQD